MSLLLLFRYHGRAATSGSSIVFSTPRVDEYVRVDVTFRHLVTGETKTVRFANRNPVVEYASAPSAEYIATLQRIDGIGMSTGQSGVPVQVTGTISVRDPYESFGLERRVFDLFERYTPIGQTVVVYSLRKALEDDFDESDWVQRFSGVCESASKSFNGQTDELTFSVSSNPIPERVVTKEIDDSLGGESGSLGRYLPICVGTNTFDGSNTNYVAAILTRKSSDTQSAKYFYATQRGNAANGFTTTDTMDISQLIARGEDGKWRHLSSNTSLVQIAIAGSGTTPVPFAATETALVVQDAVTPRISNVSRNFVYTWGRCLFKGQNNIALSPAGQIIFRLYQMSEFGASAKPAKLLATANVEKSDYYMQLRGSSDFWVYFAFDRAVIDTDDTDDSIVGPAVIISYQLSEYDTSTTDFVPASRADTSLRAIYERVGSDWGGIQTSADYPVLELGGMSITAIASDVDANGLRAVGLELEVADPTTFAASPVPLRKPELSFEFLLGNRSAKSTDTYVAHPTPGLILGGAGGDLERPWDLFAFLTSEWSGSAWALSNLVDLSHFEASNELAEDRATLLHGAFEGRLTLSEALEQLCRQTGGKIIQLSNGKLAFWTPPPSRGDPVRVLTDEDVRVTAWKRLDRSSVINSAKVYAQRDLRNLNEATGASGQFAGYRIGVSQRWDTDLEGAILAQASQQLYGERELADVEHPLIKDTESAENRAAHYLRTFDHPHDLITIEAPFSENEEVEQLDRVDLLTPALAAHHGTAANARLPVYAAAEVSIVGVRRWRRAQRHRCEVVAKRLSWQSGESMKLQLDLRVITPGHPNEPV